MVNYLQNFKNEIKAEFQEYYNENWEQYEGEWDDFKDEAVETLWNSGNYETIVKDYKALLVMLDIIKENYEEFDIDFKDYNDPQKIFNTGMYFLAREVVAELNEQDYQPVEDCFVIDEHIVIEPLQA